MKTNTNSPTLTASKLKTQLKAKSGQGSEHDHIRLHRAISWLTCAEEHHSNDDLKFITLWIAFNACYSVDFNKDYPKYESEQFKNFINQLVLCDTENRFFDLLWKKYSGAIRILLNNKFAYKEFWEAQKDPTIPWEHWFQNSNFHAEKHLQQQEVAPLLTIVLERLYTVRNQLIHGGATYKSKVNRSQVKDAGTILHDLMPLIIGIMITHHHENWGEIAYPVLEL